MDIITPITRAQTTECPKCQQRSLDYDFFVKTFNFHWYGNEPNHHQGGYKHGDLHMSGSGRQQGGGQGISYKSRYIRIGN